MIWKSKVRLRTLSYEVVLALSFLSRMPLKVPHRQDWMVIAQRIPRYFTLVGYVPGALYALGAQFTPIVGLWMGLVSLSVGYYLFDLFHFDGLLDTLDGFLNQSNPNKRLEIMSKGNVGPSAVFYGTLFVVALWEFMKLGRALPFLLSSVLGRFSMNVALALSSPAKTTGLGALLYPTDKLATVSSLLFSVPLILLSPFLYTVGLVTSILVGALVAKASKQLIGGITGDVLGASCLIAQVTILGVLHFVGGLF